MSKQNIWGLSIFELETLTTREGYEKYRGKQISDYIYRRGIHDFNEMKQLPNDLRKLLSEHYIVDFPVIVRHQITADKTTSKVLLRYADGTLVETVLMNQPYGYSVCVSTQVGCAVGCTFCASGQHGLIRNLTMAEMLAQIYTFKFLFDISVHSVVLMGSGEPLQNYDEVLRFIHRCNDETGLNMSYRNITLSTSGIVPSIYRLADEKLPITLALSLHAPNDTIRNKIMPISKKYPLKEILDSLKYYFKSTKRRITCEYILIKGINDGPEHADELANLLRPLRCHVNLIPLNENEGIHLFRPNDKIVDSFCKKLNEMGISATIRKEMGKEIQAACGQLRMKFINEMG